jgi:DNA-binding CsgD family transcriptional regulator/pimeloyl-ACP methyl ester carboxylesterase
MPALRYTTTGDGVGLAYTVTGAGPTLVWMPSLGNLVAQWRVPALREAYRRLAGRVRLVLYDGRGTGASDRRIDPAGLGLDGQLQDLTAVLDAAGPRHADGSPDQVALLGYYHSVPAAVAYAARHPQRVSRLVLFGGALQLRAAMSPQQTQALLFLVDRDWELFAQTAAHAWLGWDSGDNGRLIAEVFRTACSPDTAKELFRHADSIDVSAEAAHVRAPALVLHRQGVRQLPVEVSRQLADALPHGVLHVLDGSTPTLFVENPGADMNLVTAFLGGDDVPAAREPDAAHDPPDTGPGAQLPLLTDRELQVLRLLAGGSSNRQIARALGIAEHTVERHVGNLYRKIGARSRADAAAHAVRQGLA